METTDLERIRKGVGVIPGFIRYFPGFTKISGFPLRDRFLLSPELYNDLCSDNPTPYTIGLAIHEMEHIKRAKELGFWKYHIWYRLSKKFRYQEELECHKPQFHYFKNTGFDFDLEHRAKILSSSLYLWPVKYEKALIDLQEVYLTS